MQQLDLFAVPQEPPKAEKQPAETVVKPVVAEEAPVTEPAKENDQPIAAGQYLVTEEEAVADTQPETAPVPAPKQSPKKTDPETAAAPAGNKRGRKSFKEIDAEMVSVDIPEDDILFQKQYYAISEVAKWFNVNQSLLRYWENEFTILKPRKTRKGDRLFRPEDIKNLQVIYYLLRQRKFSIEGARQYLKDNRRKVDMQMQLIQSLTKIRAFLLEWKANLGT